MSTWVYNRPVRAIENSRNEEDTSIIPVDWSLPKGFDLAAFSCDFISQLPPESGITGERAAALLPRLFDHATKIENESGLPYHRHGGLVMAVCLLSLKHRKEKLGEKITAFHAVADAAAALFHESGEYIGLGEDPRLCIGAILNDFGISDERLLNRVMDRHAATHYPPFTHQEAVSKWRRRHLEELPVQAARGDMDARSILVLIAADYFQCLHPNYLNAAYALEEDWKRRPEIAPKVGGKILTVAGADGQMIVAPGFYTMVMEYMKPGLAYIPPELLEEYKEGWKAFYERAVQSAPEPGPPLPEWPFPVNT